MAGFARELKKNFRIGIISDKKTERANTITTMYEWNELFEEIIVSHTVGSTKRTSEIFEIAFDKFRFTPSECIFIDNSLRNVESGEKFGMNSVHFDDEVRDFDELREMIEKIVEANQ